MTRYVRPKTARLYLSTELNPISVPDPGRYLIHYGSTWWDVRAAATTVHGRRVYVELERPTLPGVVPIRRDPMALKTALFHEGRRSAGLPNHEAEVQPWAR